MTKIATAVLIAIVLAGPAPSLAASHQADPSHPQPSSYAPGPRTGPHVYGSPIETGGAGHAEAVHRPHAAPKQQPKRQKHESRDRKPRSGRSTGGSRQGPG